MQHRPIPQTITIIALALCIIFFLIYCVDKPLVDASAIKRLPHSPALNMPTHSKEAAQCRKEEEAMAKATLEREKEAAQRQLQEKEAAATATSRLVPPLVVSPPSTSNLNSLLTGHIGQDTNGTQEDGTVPTAMEGDIINGTGKPPKQKKPKKSKSSEEDKEDGATQHEQCSLALKQSRAAAAVPTSCPPAPTYKYE